MTRSSLDVVEDVVRRELDAQERRAESIDARAGFVLGFAGVLVSVGAGQVWAPLALVAQLLAGGAALCALAAASPRRVTGMDVASLRQHYEGGRPVVAQAAMIDSYVVVVGRMAQTTRDKRHRLRDALVLLAAAVTVTVAGATVEVLL